MYIYIGLSVALWFSAEYFDLFEKVAQLKLPKLQVVISPFFPSTIFNIIQG